MVARHGMMQAMGRTIALLFVLSPCGEAPIDPGTDGGSPYAPCGLELAPQWRVTAIDKTVNDMTDDGLISYGVDLDATTDRVCMFDDAVDVEGRRAPTISSV